jgi:Ser/Thr protein kinase RdoA (MazF antagonist)
VRKGDTDLRLVQELIDHVLPSGTQWTVERTLTGGSTQVYRVRRGADVLYLRLAEEKAASLAPEVYAHTILRERGAQVPAIVYYDPYHVSLERSVMITTEIPGTPLGQHPPDAATAAVVRAAGRDLALINQVPVVGFGWIRRDRPHVDTLTAEHTCYRDFALEGLDDHLSLLGQHVLTPGEMAEIRANLARDTDWLNVEHAWLAHGDLDVSHIYQQEGCYSGIIDFGEIRGTDRFYDLGHFNLHDTETVPLVLLPALLEGYGEVSPLPPDAEERINLASLVIGVRALARSLGRPAAGSYQAFLTRALRRVLADLRP